MGKTTRRPRARRKVAVAAGVAGAAFLSAVVLAEWLASGSGSGFAKAYTAEPLTTSSATASASLYPGGVGDLAITVVNPNPYPVSISSVTADGTITSNQDGCEAPDHGVTFSDQHDLGLVVPASTSATFELADSVAMASTSPSACQGAIFTVPVALNGGGDPAPPSGVVAANNETGSAVEADYCVVQFPSTMSAAPGATTDAVYGRIYEAGVTEAPGAPVGVLAAVGYGPSGSDPRSSTAWTWTSASFNDQIDNNDEFSASFTAPTAGTYAYTVRFSLDGNDSATYCDLDGAGSNDGQDFDLGQLGVLTVAP